MDQSKHPPKIPLGTSEEVKEVLNRLREVDSQNMFQCALDLPFQIEDAFERSRDYDVGDVPLDRSLLHLVGLGGSAIAGELLRDMLAPKGGIAVHRGTPVPHDKAGVIVSSYSGNTSEIIELGEQVVGGLRPVVFLCSGGALEAVGKHLSVPVWLIPAGYQPRAAIGWSLGYIAAIGERWGVFRNLEEKLVTTARTLREDLNSGNINEHPILRAAYPIARCMLGRNTVIFHSIRCTGAARRLAAQTNENTKQNAFPLVLPEAMHNGVEGIAHSPSEKWCLLFMTDPYDPPSLKESVERMEEYFAIQGFRVLRIPSAGENPFELTLSRVIIGDMVSLFLAALKSLDPHPIPTITALRKPPPTLNEIFLRYEARIEEGRTFNPKHLPGH